MTVTTLFSLGLKTKKTNTHPVAKKVISKKPELAPRGTWPSSKDLGTTTSWVPEITVDLFSDVVYVDVSATSKGKGFQGVVKRHGFSGVGESSHGQHNRLRAPGSIGAGSSPSKVFKGMKMGGQMGNKRVTVQNLQVIKVIPEHNLLMLKGSGSGK